MRFKVIGIGELLWDMLPEGKQMGGAPANFAYHARSLGADATVISRVGNDDLGRELITALGTLGIPNCEIALDNAHATGTVDVELRAGGQPQYLIHPDVAWDHLVIDSETMAAAGAADAVCFGSLAQRSEGSRAAIRSLVTATRPDALRIFDINLRQDFYSRAVIEESLGWANVLKLNDAELPVVAELLGWPAASPREQLTRLADQFGLGLIAYTREAAGSILCRPDGTCSEHGGVKAEVRDTIGAGDAFTAAVCVGLLLGWEIGRINEAANGVAAFVCSQPGGTPRLPEPIRQPFLSAMKGGSV